MSAHSAMYRPLELYVGLRYTRAKRRNHFISFISFTSIVGIALGITALITVMSVMNGFQKELRERILGMTSHASVIGYQKPLEDWPRAADLAIENPEVVAVAPYTQAEAMLSFKGRTSGALVRGVLPEREAQVSKVGSSMLAGGLEDLSPGDFGIVLGRELARTLGAGVGDRITLISPQANVSPVGVVPRLRSFSVVGIFEVGMYEYDRSHALIHLSDSQRLLRLDEGVNGVRLHLVDMFRAPQVVREVANSLGGAYLVSDWTREHANFFRAVQIEKTMMFVILTLIIAVAAFNIVSALVMVVTDKQADIAILRTLGSTPRSIMVIFFVQGVTVGLVGMVIGVVGGVALATNVEAAVSFIEAMVGFKFLAPDVYYITDLPSELEWGDVGFTALTAFVLAVLATVYPSWRAARTKPAQALAYE